MREQSIISVGLKKNDKYHSIYFPFSCRMFKCHSFTRRIGTMKLLENFLFLVKNDTFLRTSLRIKLEKTHSVLRNGVSNAEHVFNQDKMYSHNTDDKITMKKGF